MRRAAYISIVLLSLLYLAAKTVVDLTFQVIGRLPAPNNTLVTSTVGLDGVWINGAPASAAISTGSAGVPTINTLYAVQLNLQRTQVIGHATVNQSSAGTGTRSLYVCLYDSTAANLLWGVDISISGSGTGVLAGSATQYIAAPGVYYLAYENASTATGAGFTNLGPTANTDAIVNQNGNRFYTGSNTGSSGTCPPSIGTVSLVTGTNMTAILLEP